MYVALQGNNIVNYPPTLRGQSYGPAMQELSLMRFFSNIIFSRPDGLVQGVTAFTKTGKPVLEKNEERVLSLYQYSKNHNERNKLHFC